MRLFKLLVPALAAGFTVLASARGAFAQTAPGPFGLGAEMTTTGITGALFVYDPGPFHLDAIAGASFTHNDTALAAAARFFFPVSRSRSADFSIGPGIGLEHHDYTDDNPVTDDNRATNVIHLEGAFQIRAFLVPNVAIEATAGIGTKIANGNNNNTFTLGGQVGGDFGIVYFF